MIRKRLGILLLVVMLISGSGVAAAQSVPVSGGVPISAPSGPTITLTGTTTADLDEFTPDSQSVEWDTPEGRAVFRSSGSASATIHKDHLEGTWTNLTALSVSGTTLEVDPNDKPQADVEGDADSFNFSSMAIDDGNADFVYEGTSGDTTVTVRGLASNQAVVAVDQSGTFLASATTSNAGTATFSNMPNSKHVVTIQSGGGGSGNSADPVVSDPYPEGPQSDFPTTANVTINDGDFPNDNVTVTFYRKPDGGSFSQVGTDSVTTDGGEAEITMSQPARDTYTMKASAEDTFGNVNNFTWTFATPHFLFIHNETNASERIQDNISVNMKFYKEDRVTVAERTVTDGALDYTGLPTRPFTITFEANRSWYDREFYVDSTTDNDTAYLLNSTAFPNAKTIEFELDDRTGDFNPDESNIRIQRALDPENDGTLEWDQVAGDRFDATGSYFFTGETGARYRVIVENQENDRRILGPYTVLESRVEALVLGTVSWPAQNGTRRFFRANISHDPVGSDTPPVIQILYQDPTNETQNFDVEVYEKGNTSNQIFTDSASGPLNRYFTEVNVTENQSEKTWIVRIDYQYDFERVEEERVVGTKTLGLPIDGRWLGGAIMVFIPMLITLYGPRTWQYGLIVTLGVLGILMMFQLVTIPISGYAVGMLITAAGILRTEATIT